MKASALAISLILMLVPLAGCAGSDGEVNIDLTTEEIQELIDDNIDDFLNNTTVTVNQENHNNNTTNSQTIVNHYNNTTIQQPSSLKSKSGTMAGVETTNNFVLGLTLLVREDVFPAAAAGNSASGLDGAKICVGIGTTTEGNMVDWFSSRSISFTSVPVADAAEATAKFIDGSCDAMPFSSPEEAEQKKDQLDTDNSMGGVDIWIAHLAPGEIGELSHVGNSISIVIEQSSEEFVSLISIFVSAELFGTCNAEYANSSDCSNFSFQTATRDGTSGAESMVGITTTCSYGVSYSWSTSNPSAWVYPDYMIDVLQENGMVSGLDCVYALHFELVFSTSGLQDDAPEREGYEPSTHDLSWGDWVYSVVWESTPIEQTD